ncbi:4197_t:CDS:2, partial [Gigaspora margarita]
EKESRSRSQQIDKQIEDDGRKVKKECKILLLGSGESGKSTIVKQMKIIHQNGYSKEELLHYRTVVYKNLVESAQTVVNAIRKFRLEPKKTMNRVYFDTIMEYCVGSDPTFQLSQEIVEAIDSVWNDPITRELLENNQYQFYLMDSAPYMVDVGGQRSERKKWIHCFEAVTSIIFCVALSEYDQVLLEEGSQNRMQESLILFESVINSRWFLRTSIILFLNKIDLFKLKVPRVPLKDYFPEYLGGPDINKAAKYILWRFTQTNRARLNIYPHITQATDTKN